MFQIWSVTRCCLGVELSFLRMESNEQLGEPRATRMLHLGRASIFVPELGCAATLTFRQVRGADEAKAHALIQKSHYQQGEARGLTIGAYFEDETVASRLCPRVASRNSAPFLAGAAVIDRGCMRGKPTGRADLAHTRFPTLNLEGTVRRFPCLARCR
jgi:hypothetical protein